MSKEKRIKEMAKELCCDYDCVIPCQSCAYYGYENCRDVQSAEKLYAAGYRKASEVAREIFEEIDEMIYMLSAMTGIDIIILGKYAELKKKYTEGEG